MRILTVLLFIVSSVSVCSQTIYAIGDAGEPSKSPETLELLEERIAKASENDILIFLGDNIYPKGLTSKEDPEREEMEAKLVPQLDLIKQFKGRSFFIPGNHDWAKGRSNGFERILNMQDFVHEYLGSDDIFQPQNGCPGPVEVPLNENAVLIILDTQYLLHPWDKPGEDSQCTNKSTLEALLDLKNLISENKEKNIFIAAHHPIYTYGEHNGYFTLKEHIFPLTAAKDNLYIPLPVIGSIYPLYRKAIGNIQDNTHLKYKAINKAILEAMNETENIVYLSGHEHSLQYIHDDKHHYVVSGSGCKTTAVKKKKRSQFAASKNGFAEVSINESGEVGLEFWSPEGRLFEKGLFERKFESKPLTQRPSFKDSIASVAASSQYSTDSNSRIKWLGENYRQVWETPVEVRVFDIRSEHGGLEILKRGGGMQTKSLRMEDKDGRQFVLRSIEKFPELALPVSLRNTFAKDIVQDQISASHPYGAFVVPKLADAVGIYHTNPEPVLIPDDPAFGVHQKTFAGVLALYEERPTDEVAGLPYFGGGKDVEGTDKVLEKLYEDNDNRVDQPFTLRNRLFDMVIGDWDRHDDQWRWSESKDPDGKGDIYRPIPRDRDQVFFVNQGIIPRMGARKWAIPKIEGFDEEVEWAPGFNTNARFFDRTFINELAWPDWREQIKFIQKNLTDQVIEEAINQWPKEVFDLTGERTLRVLKARRDGLERWAKEQYEFLSREVEVVGSDKHELFKVHRLNETRTIVEVFKINKEGEEQQLIFSRTFDSNTKEVRLFGLDGNDRFEFSGKNYGSTKIRVIGGTDKDRMNNLVEKPLRNVKVYDRKKSTELNGKWRGTRLSTDPAVNAYNRKEFKYDILLPLANVQYNPDDGIFLGAGFQYTDYKWRKDPFGSQQKFLINYALATGSFNLEYEASFTEAIGKWALEPSIIVQEPFFVNNYFGTGNETTFNKSDIPSEFDDEIDYFRIRMPRQDYSLGLAKRLGNSGKFYFRTGYQIVQLEEQADRFTGTLSLDLLDNAYRQNEYLSFKIGIETDTRDNKILPQRGSFAAASFETAVAQTAFSESTEQLKLEWASYLSLRLPSRLVIANRFGFDHNFSDYDFFYSNTLGGTTNLRGFRRSRFYGRTAFYHNIDLRLKLFSFRSYIFPGQMGILAFHDTGRVWVNTERSNDLHTGKGFGLWVAPVNMLVVTGNYAFGEDENLVTVSLGFQF